MKKALYIIGIALAIAGCTKSEITENTLASGEISFSAGFTTTRVGSGDEDCTWASDGTDKIGIFTDQGSSEKNLQFSVATNGAMTNLSTTTLMPLDNNADRTYYAYHPYNSAQDATSTIAIDLTSDYYTPLLWATETTNEMSVELQFSHKYAKVSFNLTAGGVEVSDAELTAATAWITGANTKGEFDITTGEFDEDKSDNSTTINLTIDYDEENDAYTIGPLYLIPSTTAAKLWIKANGNTFVKSLDEWVSGEEYEYDITVGEVPPTYLEFKRNESNTKNITKSDDGTIENLLAKFRRCLMYGNSTSGEAIICYLDNANSEKYNDGTTADLTGGEGDVMVYFPEYWYKYENVDDNTFRYYISESAEDGYVHVEASLVGAYKGYEDNEMLYSYSGVTPTTEKKQTEYIAYAKARGTGYQIIDYEQHCTIAMMLYAKYEDRDTQDVLGTGSAGTSTKTGLTNSLGNTDGMATWVNGLAIEGVYGGIFEWVQGVEISDYVWTITDTNGTRTVTAGSSDGWITAMAIEGYSGSSNSDVGYSNSTTQYFDMVPTAASGGSATTDYADYYSCSSDSIVLARSFYSSYTNGGVAYSGANHSSSYTHSYYGSRLAFRGKITEETSVAAYKELFTEKD